MYHEEIYLFCIKVILLWQSIFSIFSPLTVRAITISGYRFRALRLGEIKTKTKQIWPRGTRSKKNLFFFFFFVFVFFVFFLFLFLFFFVAAML